VALAYVFWHTPDPEVDTGRYEAALASFLEALLAAPPRGLRDCASHRIAAPPWLPAERTYEDWYVVEDHEALGAIGPGAVSGAPAAPHHEVAALSAEGSAGLYACLAGAPDGAGASSCWLDKPRGLAYPDFKLELSSALASPGSLWQRELVLGPAPEFCLLGEEAEGPPGRDAIRLDRFPIGSGPAASVTGR